MTRAERERLRERLALFALSGVVALAALLVVGVLLTENVIRGYQPVARIEGRTVARLRDYADVLGYRQNSLMMQYEFAANLARQPSSPGDDASVSQALAQQQLQFIQQQLSSLQLQVVEDLIDAELIRAEAARREVVATLEEVTAELKRLIGFAAAEAVGAPTPGTADATGVDPQPTPTTRSGARAAENSGRTGKRDPQGFESQLRLYLRATGGSRATAEREATIAVLRRKLQVVLEAEVPPEAEQVRARHILVADETAAQAVLTRLKAGEAFEGLAAELSTDPGSKEKGGDLGWFPRGVMVQEFEQEAFRVAPGQISNPVRSSFGYHIIRVDERETKEVGPEMLQSLKSNALSTWLQRTKRERNTERSLDSWKIEWAQRHAPQPRA